LLFLSLNRSGIAIERSANMDSMNEYRSPGFYPDPENPMRERWWNGQGWSDSYQGDEESDTRFSAPASASGGDENPAGPVIHPGSLEALEAFALGAGVKPRKTATVKQALIFTCFSSVVGLAVSIILLQSIILGFLWVAVNIFILFMVKRQAERESANPERDLPQALETIRSTTPETVIMQQSQGRPGLEPPPDLPQISPEIAHKAGRAIRNAITAAALGFGLFVVGIIMIFATEAIWGTPGVDGGTSVTGGPAFLAIIGALLAIIGFIASIPAGVIAFIVTLNKKK